MKFCQIILLCFAISEARASTIQEHCDIPGADLKNLKTMSPQACQAECKKEAGCQAFTFASGWNKCFLKAQDKARFTIRFISAKVKGEDNPQGQLDKDLSGKDIKKVTTESEHDCIKACQEHSECVEVTYIAGYKACWLKKTSGKWQDKIFYCGKP